MRNDEKQRIIIILLFIAFVIQSLIIGMGVALINDKTNMILELQDEKQECLSNLEELLQENVAMDKKLREYKRVYGELGD